MTAHQIPFLSKPIRVKVKRGTMFGFLILAALIAFEIFNYSTTDFALSDLLGELRFWGVRWSTILALAFCGIDFAGIARLFTPEEGADEPAEVWYLFGAWMLAATMNAMLTWWGVSIAILNHDSLGNAVVSRAALLRVAPIFVAVLVWLMRVLIIGTFSVAGERLFSQDDEKQARVNPFRVGSSRRATVSSRTASGRKAAGSASYRPAPRPAASSREARREPRYEPVSARSTRSSSQQARF